MESDLIVRKKWLIDNNVQINKFIIDMNNKIQANTTSIKSNKIYDVLEGILIVFYYRRYLNFLETNETYVLAKDLFIIINQLWKQSGIVKKMNDLLQKIITNNFSELSDNFYDLNINIKYFKNLNNPDYINSIDDNITLVVNTYLNRQEGTNWNTDEIILLEPIGTIPNPFLDNIEYEIRENNPDNSLNNVNRRLFQSESENNYVNNYRMENQVLQYSYDSINTANTNNEYNLVIGNRNNRYITNLNINSPVRDVGPFPENNLVFRRQNFIVVNHAVRDIDTRIKSAMSVKRKIEYCDKNYSSGECMICLENTENVLSCGHGCHQECIIPTADMKCPMCKKEVDLDDDIEYEIYKKRILLGKPIPVVISMVEEPGNTQIINWY